MPSPTAPFGSRILLRFCRNLTPRSFRSKPKLTTARSSSSSTLPMFDGPRTVSDEDFLKQFGPVLNYGDLAPHDELFENWSHLNHAGAMNASGRLADAIAGLDL